MTQPCDFCASQCADPVEYAIDPTDVPVKVTALNGRILRTVVPVLGCWRACPVCTALVEAGDAKALLERSERVALGHVAALVTLSPARRKQFLKEHRRGLVRLHAKFWAGYSDEGESAA